MYRNQSFKDDRSDILLTFCYPQIVMSTCQQWHQIMPIRLHVSLSSFLVIQFVHNSPIIGN